MFRLYLRGVLYCVVCSTTQTCPLSWWTAAEGSLRPVCGSSPELGPKQKADSLVQSAETKLEHQQLLHVKFLKDCIWQVKLSKQWLYLHALL